jgi:hypothetical protein
MIALAATVVAFGLQSTLDWTWFFAGVAVPVLLCAGWLAGRGPLQEGAAAQVPASAGASSADSSGGVADPSGAVAGASGASGSSAGASGAVAGASGASATPRASVLDRLAARPLAAAGLVALVVCTLAVCWLQWRPLHSAQQLSASETDRTTAQAFPAARAAASSDPLSTFPPSWLSQLYLRLGNAAQARAELVHARNLQPQNPSPWLVLAQFDQNHGRTQDAIAGYRHVLELDHSRDFDATDAVDGLTTLGQPARSP